jgi:large subunit ribosomal protein L4
MVKNKKTKLTINLYDLSGKLTSELPVGGDIFTAKKNPKLVAQAIKVYLSNQRKSHSRVKTRGEVVGSTRKIWRQKGTGRARHGSLTAPIFVGGGIVHGPTGQENWKLSINKKMKKAALASVISEYLSNSKICAISDLAKIEPKTKKAEGLVKALAGSEKKLLESKKVLFVVDKMNSKIKMAFGNLKGKGITVETFSGLNTYLVLRNNYLIFDKKVLEIEK